MKFIRTNSKHQDFIDLVEKLDLDLSIRDGEDHTFYNQFNNIESLNHTIVVYDLDKAVGCGAFKFYSKKIVEIKRMYTLPEYRGKGVASYVLGLLEKWALELEYKSTVLETGYKQPEAIQLYKKNNYFIIDNYGVYKGLEGSVCFKKNI